MSARKTSNKKAPNITSKRVRKPKGRGATTAAPETKAEDTPAQGTKAGEKPRPLPVALTLAICKDSAGKYEVVCWLPSWHVQRKEVDPETAIIARLAWAQPQEQVRPVQVQAGPGA